MKRLFVLLFVLFVSACSRADRDTLKRPGQPDVTYVKADDPAMEAAIAKARGSLSSFRSALAAPPSGTSDFAVKVAFPTGKGTDREHIWLLEPSFTPTTVVGIVNNEPVDVTPLQLGQRVSASIHDVSDWMYVENGVLRGGYTLRVLLGRLSPSERAEMLQQMSFRLE